MSLPLAGTAGAQAKTQADNQRPTLVAQAVAGLESYARANSTFQVQGTGFFGTGTGWFNHDQGFYNASTAQTLLQQGHLTTAVTDPTDNGTAVSDQFMVYFCKDRAAVFSKSDGLQTSPLAAAWWANNGCTTSPITEFEHPYFQLTQPLSSLIDTQGDNQRPTLVRAAVAGLESYARANSTFLVQGTGFFGTGTGWFNHDQGFYNASTAQTLLQQGHLTTAVTDPTDNGTAVSDQFMVYFCKDRAAVFSKSNGLQPTTQDRTWWNNNGCTTSPINDFEHPYYQLTQPLSSLIDTQGDNQRPTLVRAAVAGLESYARANSTFLVQGTGFFGTGTGWFNHDQGFYNASTAQTLLQQGHLTAPVTDPTDNGTAVSDQFMVYLCKDRAAVFSKSNGLQPTTQDRTWWTNNGCTTSPITDFAHPYYQLTQPLSSLIDTDPPITNWPIDVEAQGNGKVVDVIINPRGTGLAAIEFTISFAGGARATGCPPISSGSCFIDGSSIRFAVFVSSGYWSTPFNLGRLQLTSVPTSTSVSIRAAAGENGRTLRPLSTLASNQGSAPQNRTFAGGAEDFSANSTSDDGWPFGDVNCDAKVSIIDALLIAQASVGNRSEALTCMEHTSNPAGAPLNLVALRGDINADGATNVVDALVVARCVVGAEVPTGCGHECASRTDGCELAKFSSPARGASLRCENAIVQWSGLGVDRLTAGYAGSPTAYADQTTTGTQASVVAVPSDGSTVQFGLWADVDDTWRLIDQVSAKACRITPDAQASLSNVRVEDGNTVADVILNPTDAGLVGASIHVDLSGSGINVGECAAIVCSESVNNDGLGIITANLDNAAWTGPTKVATVSFVGEVPASTLQSAATVSVKQSLTPGTQSTVATAPSVDIDRLRARLNEAGRLANPAPSLGGGTADNPVVQLGSATGLDISPNKAGETATFSWLPVPLAPHYDVKIAGSETTDVRGTSLDFKIPSAAREVCGRVKADGVGYLASMPVNREWPELCVPVCSADETPVERRESLKEAGSAIVLIQGSLTRCAETGTDGCDLLDFRCLLRTTIEVAVSLLPAELKAFVAECKKSVEDFAVSVGDLFAIAKDPVKLWNDIGETVDTFQQAADEGRLLSLLDTMASDAVHLDLLEDDNGAWEINSVTLSSWIGRVGCEILIGFLLGGPVAAKIGRIMANAKVWKALPDSDKGPRDSDKDRNGTCSSIDVLNSFPAGTPVLLGNGEHKPIEDIDPGDTVLAYNHQTQQWRPQTVTAHWSHLDNGHMATVTIADGTTMTATDHHLFWETTEQAWTELDQLEPGDQLLTPTGTTTITNLDIAPQTQTLVWEITVNQDHNYTVSTTTTDLLVHNNECPQSSGILRDAARGKGNFGIGSSTAAHADELGQAWVGAGFRRSSSNPAILVSADGLRQYRPPSYKPNQGGYQANFEWRNVDAGPWQGNGHLDITDLATDLGR